MSQQTSNSKVTNSFISPIASEGQIFLKQREDIYDVNEHLRLKSATPALKQKLKTIPKILSISKKGHVTFANRTPHGRNSNCDSAKSGASTEPQVEDSGSEKTLDSETPELFPRKSEPDVTGVGVYMRIDRLGPGDCFVSVVLLIFVLVFVSGAVTAERVSNTEFKKYEGDVDDDGKE